MRRWQWGPAAHLFSGCFSSCVFISQSANPPTVGSLDAYLHPGHVLKYDESHKICGRVTEDIHRMKLQQKIFFQSTVSKVKIKSSSLTDGGVFSLEGNIYTPNFQFYRIRLKKHRNQRHVIALSEYLHNSITIPSKWKYDPNICWTALDFAHSPSECILCGSIAYWHCHFYFMPSTEFAFLHPLYGKIKQGSEAKCSVCLTKRQYEASGNILKLMIQGSEQFLLTHIITFWQDYSALTKMHL